MADFELLAAIDLRGGRVVRLRVGDFARETVFSDDPVAVGERFAAAGLRWLHVVDLDGARAGGTRQAVSIARLVGAVGSAMAVEVAGGLRDADAVAAAFEAGATRVVVGTLGLTDPEAVGRLVAQHGARAIAAAIDVRQGRAFGHGWDPGSASVDALTAARRLAGVGVATFEVTAIERDGGLRGPDLEGLAAFVASGLSAIVASGGVRTIDDLRRLRAAGCTGAIVGRALYDGGLDPAAAIVALAAAPSGEG